MMWPFSRKPTTPAVHSVTGEARREGHHVPPYTLPSGVPMDPDLPGHPALNASLKCNRCGSFEVAYIPAGMSPNFGCDCGAFDWKLVGGGE